MNPFMAFPSPKYIKVNLIYDTNYWLYGGKMYSTVLINIYVHHKIIDIMSTSYILWFVLLDEQHYKILKFDFSCLKQNFKNAGLIITILRLH